MSRLTSHYEISVWEDKWNNGKFEEQKVCVIGSDEMTSQSKLIEPNFNRNVNGQKKLSFKMYKQYIDNITGLKVINPFSKFLSNETKVKLYYENRWYDFYIKNIVENSSTYLYTYQLEDSLVQELSKNGYGVTFDAELMNNLGTADQLAAAALKDSGWGVSGSETLVEKVEENLVYIKLNKKFTATRLRDQKNSNLSVGIIPYETKVEFNEGTIILGFYSACTNKPHRFQFIYLDDYKKDKVKIDENRVIDEEDCHYYIDLDKPLSSSGYVKSSDFWLPNGMQVDVRTGGLDDVDSTISGWYRGKRYGYANTTIYIPLLNSYCTLYNKFDKNSKDYVREEIPDINGIYQPKKYYAYSDSEYNSPIFTQNIITNSDFKGTTGWTGTYFGTTPNMKSTVGTKVDCLYGYFNNFSFSSVQEELKNGCFNDSKGYLSYLKVAFQPSVNDNIGILINSGFYDNRSIITNIENGEEWIFQATVLNESGTEVRLDAFNVQLQEVEYNTQSGAYNLKQKWGELSNDSIVINFPEGVKTLSETEFKNKNIRLVIYPKETSESAVYYISKIEMFKKVLNSSGQPITPGDLSTEGVVNNYISFVEESAINEATSKEELNLVSIKEEDLDYSVYVPVYNTGAEKIRTITIAKSNYFNILQTIAETFECWLDIEVERNDELNPGKITAKNIRFKNYAGDVNYAAFRYGVNLKDISRTFESKQLVTKLIVEQNNNEFGKNGFCTIARAGSNPTGENYIYDFQYFHNQGKLNTEQFLADMYYAINPKNSEIVEAGPDIENSTGFNLQNYYNRVKKLNSDLMPISEEIINYSTELTALNAEKAIQEGLRDAAAEGIEESTEKFYALTGLYPNQIDEEALYKAESLENLEQEGGKWYESDYNYKSLNSGWDFETIGNPSIDQTHIGADNSLQWDYKISFPTMTQKEIEVSTNGSAYWKDYDENAYKTKQGFLSCTGAWDGLKIDIKDSGEKPVTFQLGKRYKLSYKLSISDGELETIGSHMGSFTNIEIWVNGTLYSTTYSTVGFNSNIDDLVYVEIYGTFYSNKEDPTPFLYIQPNRGTETHIEADVADIKLEEYVYKTNSRDKTFYIQPIFRLTPQTIDTETGEVLIGVPTTRNEKIACKIKANDITGSILYTLPIFDSTQTTENTLNEYITYKIQYQEAINKLYGNSIINDQYEIIEYPDTNSLIVQIKAKEEALEVSQTRQKNILDIKTQLNQLFYTTYSRFIQEGTWMSEDYYDDDKYYNDALSVLYNSCYPQVQYTINVLALKGLPGYENFDFHLGDTTYAEDPDFFGDDLRTEVVIMEINENLDDASKSTIKVQNFKNQFQDLFQKITATVQQTQYNTGAYKKAVDLAEANSVIKSKFINEGLSSMGNALSIAGQTSVVQDVNGITLTDSATKNQMRLIGGAIMMSIEDGETGQRKWKTGLTPDGISASLITAGNINAGEISIMNANEPTFKWNAFGISAFDTDWTNNLPNGKVDPYTFVRFDKNGLYGINSKYTTGNVSINGENWAPSSLDEIRENAIFSLTWDGLTLRPGNAMYYRQHPDTKEIIGQWHTSSAVMGKVDDHIYNDWDANGNPIFNEAKIGNPEFVKIFATGNGQGNETLVIYDDGTLTCENIKLPGSISWTAASSPSKSVYGKASLVNSLPANGTTYNQFEEEDDPINPRWHKNVDTINDVYYAHTDDGGATWTGPYLLTGKSIQGTEVEYVIASAGLNPETIKEGWNSQYPSTIPLASESLYIRMYDMYNNGEKSEYRYSIGGGQGQDGNGAISCYVESLSGSLFEDSITGVITLTARILQGAEEIDPYIDNIDQKLSYVWYINNIKQDDLTTKQITINFDRIKNQSIYFEAQ